MIENEKYREQAFIYAESRELYFYPIAVYHIDHKIGQCFQGPLGPTPTVELWVKKYEPGPYAGGNAFQQGAIASENTNPNTQSVGTQSLIVTDYPTKPVPENITNVNIVIERFGDPKGGVAVSCRTKDGTAIAGEDYVANTQKLSWNDQVNMN